MKLFRLYQLFALGATMLLFPACDGILDGIYDQPRTTTGYGFNPNGDGTGTLFIDATDYAQWTYINLHTEEIDSTASPERTARRYQWEKTPHCLLSGTSLSTATM